MQSIKDLFMLDPNVIYLNHGSFGACPREVFEIYQEWQLRLERQPVDFLARQAVPLLGWARSQLADFLGVSAADVVYFPNPTTAINMVARNLPRLSEGFSGSPLREGDEILSTNHEYGALDRTWRYISAGLNIFYVNRALPLPLAEPDELVEHFWAGVSERTRIIYLSHITSPTGLIFPVQEICRRARQAGILSIVDGAHAPGQIKLNITEVGADIYTGACHKWLMAPKGSAFLYVREELQEFLDPLIISWGYQPDAGFGTGLTFIDQHEWQGTRDIAAFLSVPAAIEFQKIQEWEKVRQDCHNLAVEARKRITDLTGLELISNENAFRQMFAVLLPDEIDPSQFMHRLYDIYQIEAPVTYWNGKKLLRISIQGYNQSQDIDALCDALRKLVNWDFDDYSFPQLA